MIILIKCSNKMFEASHLYFVILLENLELADDVKMITHPEVGKYFREFNGNHYYPNDEKLAQYPEDMPLTLQFCQEKYGS